MNTEVTYMIHHYNYHKCIILNHCILTSDFFYSSEHIELGWVQYWSFSMLVTGERKKKKSKYFLSGNKIKIIDRSYSATIRS